jgi:hypothetical protein
MGVESNNTLTPIKLDLHESIKVGIVLGSWKIVVSLDVCISLRLDPGEEVCNLVSSVVVDVAESFNF